jgi:hypothetical protein
MVTRTLASVATLVLLLAGPTVAMAKSKLTQVSGSLNVSGTFGSCTGTLFGGVPPGKTLVLTSVAVDTTDTVRPEWVVWLRQQTGSGFFTHFMGVPLSAFTVNGMFSGTLDLNVRVTPGGSAANDISDVFVCLAPGTGDSSTSGHYFLTGTLE